MLALTIFIFDERKTHKKSEDFAVLFIILAPLTVGVYFYVTRLATLPNISKIADDAAERATVILVCDIVGQNRKVFFDDCQSFNHTRSRISLVVWKSGLFLDGCHPISYSVASSRVLVLKNKSAGFRDFGLEF